MSDTRPIGIFDSGVGGLTVVNQIFERLPAERIIYFGDTARVPYGTKSPEVIERFALEDIFFLLNRDVKILVAACHTVSSTVLDKLISTMHLPILGVVEPGVKAAINVTKNLRVGVIGTRATVMSGAYEEKIKARRNDITVVSQACPLFVPLAEEGWLDNEVTHQIASLYLKPLKQAGIDTLILGCTHYPLLRNVIESFFGKDVTIIDSAEETAKRVAERLRMFRMKTERDSIPEHQFFVSDIPHQFQEVGERFLSRSLETLSRVELDSISVKEGLEQLGGAKL